MADFTRVHEFEVSPAALEARIRRRLKRDELILRKTRGKRAWLDLGEYYIVDYNNRNFSLTAGRPAANYERA